MSKNIISHIPLKLVKNLLAKVGIFLAPVTGFFERIIRTGTQGLDDEETYNRVRMTNTLSLSIGIAIISIAPLVYYFIPKISLLIPIVIELLVNLSVILFNKYRQYLVAALVLYFLQCIAIIYFCFLLGGIIQLQSMVIFLLSIICLIFKQVHIRIIALVGAVITFVILQAGYYYNVITPIKVSYDAGYAIQTAAMVGVIGMLIVIALPFIRSNDRNYALKRKNSSIKMFVAQVTHEMRSPLNAISLIAKILKREIKKDPSLKKIEPYTDMLIVGSNTTRTIVNNVLDMAIIESGKTETSIEQTFFVRPFFSKLIELSQFIGKSRDMKICLLIDQVPSVIICDPLKLSQIMNNLLSNAIKYGIKNSTVTVTLSRPECHSWTIEVKNESLPIDEEQRKILFEPFVTGKTEVTEGTGLGLYIVRNRVLSMGGDIEINCIDDHYIVFKITLPLRIGKLKDVEPEDEEEEISLTNLNKAKVLIAEDDPSNANALALALSNAGCITDIAGNGKELLSKAMHQPPDIIMLDYDMPQMNGITAMQQLKENPILKHIPVIVITGDIFTNSVDRLMEAGADAYILKPFNDSSLLFRIVSRHLHPHNSRLKE